MTLETLAKSFLKKVLRRFYRLRKVPLERRLHSKIWADPNRLLPLKELVDTPGFKSYQQLLWERAQQANERLLLGDSRECYTSLAAREAEAIPIMSATIMRISLIVVALDTRAALVVAMKPMVASIRMTAIATT